ncbi:MAG: ATP-dependent helicase [Planctomycetota bacterium]
MSDHRELFDLVAGVICNKPVGLSPEDCYSGAATEMSLCRSQKGCRLSEKTAEQLLYVRHNLKAESFLRACPGSGKTEVVGLKAAYTLKRRNWQSRGIALLSFTNNAADVIRERVSQFASVSLYPHFIGTVDSWLHGYILNPFGHLLTGYTGKEGDRSVRIIGDESKAGFLNAFKTKYQYGQCGHVRATEYHLDADGNIVLASGNAAADLARERDIREQWQIKDLADTKRRFWLAGFATYQDVEAICYAVLKKCAQVRNRLSSRFPVVIIDECQDLTSSQLQLFQALREAGTYLHLVGDLNQAVYSFRRVYPEKVREFVAEKGLQELALTENFRSVQEIVNMCGHLADHGSIRGRDDGTTKPACVYCEYEKGALAGLPNKFAAYLQTRGYALEHSAVVARGYATVKKLSPVATETSGNATKRLALAIALWPTAGIDNMTVALETTGSAIVQICFPDEHADARHYYCPASCSSGVDWRLFLAHVLDKCSIIHSLVDFDQDWSSWAGNLRQNLVTVVEQCWGRSPPNTDVAKDLRAPSGESSNAVQESISMSVGTDNSRLRVTTFHKVKGETLDAVLVVSSPDKHTDGGHWTQWLDHDPANAEHARFAYVASSRPRFLLAWAIPCPTNTDKQRLEALGFQHVDL